MTEDINKAIAIQNYKNLFSLFIDKFIPQAIGTLTKIFNIDQHILVGNKSINHYFNLHHNISNEIKMCDYNIITSNLVNKAVIKRKLTILTTKCNHIFNDNYNLNSFLYNNIIKEINVTSKSEYSLIEISNTTKMDLFYFDTETNTVYLKVFYKYNPITNKEYLSDELYSNPIGIIICDLCKNYYIQLTDENINTFNIREWEYNKYDPTIGLISLYVPDIDIILVSLFFNSYNINCDKTKIHKQQLDIIIELLKNPYDNINFILFNNPHTTYHNFLKIRLPLYNAEFKQLFDSKTITCINDDYYNFINLISRMLNKCSLLISTNFIESICLLKNCSPCINEVSDIIITKLISYYKNIVTMDENDKTYLANYISSSYELNIPLITQQPIENTYEWADTLLKYMTNTAYKQNNIDFFVYSVSQIFTINNHGKSYFNINDIYTFPSFKSTTYRVCSTNHIKFIGYDINSFIMRIYIKSSINNGEYCFIGMNTNQYEVLIAYGAQVKITDISRCYIKLTCNSNTHNYYQNCWLIDCELLPKITELPSDILDQPKQYGGWISPTNTFIQAIQEDTVLSNSSYINNVFTKLSNKVNTKLPKDKVNTGLLIDFIKYQTLVNAHIKHNKFSSI